jgi:RNA polymerase sigma-70 factor (ECF subfamily)
VSSWIFKIALNTARDRLRQPSFRNSACGCGASSPAREIDEDVVVQMADTRSRTPEEGLVRSEMIQCFVDFVSKLPRQYSEVYVLSEFEELPDKAISKGLALPLETAKMRLHRARARLYDELRAHCRCYYNERGELMGDRKQAASTIEPARKVKKHR